MENIKIKKSKGRPQYIPNIEQLKELFKQVANKTITNEERMASGSVARKQNGMNWKNYMMKKE